MYRKPTGRKSFLELRQFFDISKVRCENSLSFSKVFYPTTDEDYPWTCRHKKSFSLLSPTLPKLSVKAIGKDMKGKPIASNRTVGMKPKALHKGLKLVVKLFGPVPVLTKEGKNRGEKWSVVKVDASSPSQRHPYSRHLPIPTATLSDLTHFEETSKRARRRGSHLLSPCRSPLTHAKTNRKVNFINIIKPAESSDSLESDSQSSGDEGRKPLLRKSEIRKLTLKKSVTSILPELSSQTTDCPIHQAFSFSNEN